MQPVAGRQESCDDRHERRRRQRRQQHARGGHSGSAIITDQSTVAAKSSSDDTRQYAPVCADIHATGDAATPPPTPSKRVLSFLPFRFPSFSLRAQRGMGIKLIECPPSQPSRQPLNTTNYPIGKGKGANLKGVAFNGGISAGLHAIYKAGEPLNGSVCVA